MEKVAILSYMSLYIVYSLFISIYKTFLLGVFILGIILVAHSQDGPPYPILFGKREIDRQYTLEYHLRCLAAEGYSYFIENIGEMAGIQIAQAAAIREIECIIARGVDVNCCDDCGDSPLHSASFYGHTEIVDVLLAHGADPFKKNNRGETMQFEFDPPHSSTVHYFDKNGALRSGHLIQKIEQGEHKGSVLVADTEGNRFITDKIRNIE